jgi:hypothetical protein
LLTCGACNFSPWFGGWRVEWFDFASLTLLFFWILSRDFSKFLQRETKFLGWFPRSLNWCLLPPKAFERASTSYSMACMFSFG